MIVVVVRGMESKIRFDDEDEDDVVDDGGERSIGEGFFTLKSKTLS